MSIYFSLTSFEVIFLRKSAENSQTHLSNLNLSLSRAMKLLCHAFDLTLKEFDIKGSHLSETSEVASGTISNFRNDLCAITTDSLEKLLEALSDEEFTFWLSQVAHAREIEDFTHDPVAIDGFVSKLDDESTANLLTALAGKLRKSIRRDNPHRSAR